MLNHASYGGSDFLLDRLGHHAKQRRLHGLLYNGGKALDYALSDSAGDKIKCAQDEANKVF